MNIAFSSVLIFIFLTPGLIFIKSYYTFPFSKRYISFSAITDLGIAIVPAFIFHFIFIEMIKDVSGYSINFNLLGSLIFGKQEECFNNIQLHFKEIFFYNSFLWLIMLVLGHSLRITIRALDLDKKYRFFRFDNEWHYILSGEILLFPSYNINKRVDYKKVDVLIKTSNGDYIYKGILQEYNLTNDGKLDNICLRDLKRRKLEDDRLVNIDSANYVIPGGYL